MVDVGDKVMYFGIIGRPWMLLIDRYFDKFWSLKKN